jgi:hypothetical protein
VGLGLSTIRHMHARTHTLSGMPPHIQQQRRGGPPHIALHPYDQQRYPGVCANVCVCVCACVHVCVCESMCARMCMFYLRMYVSL